MIFYPRKCRCYDPGCTVYYLDTESGERLGVVDYTDMSAAPLKCTDEGKAEQLCGYLNQLCTPSDEAN